MNEQIEQSPKMFTTCKHLANLGDIIATLASVKRFHEVTGRKVKYCQMVNNPAAYYQGAIHPTVDKSGANVSVNQMGFDMLKPLVESQEYIYSFEPYSGQKIDLDFDVIRGQTDVHMPNGMLGSWLMYAFPDLAYDLSVPWVKVEGDCPEHIKEQVSGKIILNFTSRYRNHFMDYFFLQNYAPDLVFSGTDQEYVEFCDRWHLAIPQLKINDFKELAFAIRECRFIHANQSFHWNLANSMGAKRLLEVCKWAFNCHPNIGPNNFGYFYQMPAEYYFRRLYNETARK